ncbi:carboxylate--amine ligase/circularly permuted type 2 ATP-grasp protein [Pseudonocardia sp. KRD-184]|uniref:Putative glutamate--cysteine ligase 2 n=1 Tax=Pseudonocardia oceani TaxID=2792013 RepID=A0ABS6U5C9_9PSEU|nr:carboxylate--amine ligase/circularly permuted type 2 ATP-grasp protein [Pseudonocardia oceani]MBW0090983.1 carboxylate--amine ligase/circularly permuted type 2 ATP-grasp protein [Pseudonocardia oceani]MBW0098106.1 carboxylate--amine ligase/circularly permuted type 2 ATP-grasp protein [Pseudonocardia oceani]MBW0124714.1 carboxylate--amine ligase/circularly permuted type 2 ATP-grasp protein [Pseudonocardia oceani]MBW0127431.1 carboxylate--amine ligase/circularly permuted type 2 ATP-grasp prote
MTALPLLGAEEEFHVVDLESRRSAPEVDALLARLDGAEFAPELQRSLVETNSPVCATLDDLRHHLRRLRATLESAAEPLGLGVVAAGTVPLTHEGDAVSAGARYERMQHEYQLLVSEQHICGAQVHVDVPDRDVAVQVVRRVAPYLPTLLAISASSPYWRGRDSGYASFRSMVWSRWPTAGPPGNVETAADYDAMVAELIASGTISDPGMVYFDIRPSSHLPTVELRVCDACPQVDDVVLIAGLFRALVGRARADLDAGLPLPVSRHELLRAASWRAARSGLEGDLVDLVGPSLVSPPLVVGQLVDHLRPQLEELGDWEQVLELSQATLARGSAAARQRRAYGRRGEFTDVVDALIAHTQGRTPVSEPPATVPRSPALLTAYHPTAFDEAVSEGGTVLPHYGFLFRALDRMGPRGMVAAESALRTEQRARGVTFRVGDGEPDRLFPLDLVPRIVTAEEWSGLSDGLAQRVRALEAFVRDVYGERRIVADGVVPEAVVANAPGWSRLGKLCPADAVRIAVAGIDLVRDRADHWLVLEDNLRVPSGIGYSITSRRLIRSVMPDLEPPAGVVGLEPVPGRLRSALLSATEPDEPGADEVALLSQGPADSAYFEHRLLADQMGVPLVTPRELQVTEEGVYLVGTGARRRLSALYRRIDESALMAARGADQRPVGRAIGNAVARGTVALLNALGNGVADDKLVYAYVPEMIAYYLGEPVLLANVPTYPCVDADRRAEVLDRLDQLVLKPVDGYGGQGIVIGPHADRAELAEVAEAIRQDPGGWVAQDLVSLSTHPTFAGDKLEPRAVDLRAFVLQSRHGDGAQVEVLPAALSRVAPAGSMIVNSSRGGGAKDTWVLR